MEDVRPQFTFEADEDFGTNLADDACRNPGHIKRKEKQMVHKTFGLLLSHLHAGRGRDGKEDLETRKQRSNLAQDGRCSHDLAGRYRMNPDTSSRTRRGGDCIADVAPALGPARARLAGV